MGWVLMSEREVYRVEVLSCVVSGGCRLLKRPRFSVSVSVRFSAC